MAQIDIQQKYLNVHYWAGFVLTSDPGKAAMSRPGPEALLSKLSRVSTFSRKAKIRICTNVKRSGLHVVAALKSALWTSPTHEDKRGVVVYD
jgi:hypothetical protein